MNIIEFMKDFPDEDSAILYLEEKRWGESGVCCPHCGSVKVGRKNKNEIKSGWNCLDCHSTFTVKSQTVFHGTKIPLQKWLLAISIITNAKKGISSHQLARDLDMNQKSAWYLEMRVRKAMDNKECELLAGVVEADETYVGGKLRKGRDKNAKRGRGTKKAPVVGIVERGGRVIAKFMPKISGENLFNFIIGSIKPDESILMTDEYVGYNDLDGAVPRGVVNHSENYVDDDGVTHTNTIEGFWAGIKRAFYGVHHWYSKKFINYYIAEACYKYNERANEDMFTTLVNDCLGVKA